MLAKSEPVDGRSHLPKRRFVFCARNRVARVPCASSGPVLRLDASPPARGTSVPNTTVTWWMRSSDDGICGHIGVLKGCPGCRTPGTLKIPDRRHPHNECQHSSPRLLEWWKFSIGGVLSAKQQWGIPRKTTNTGRPAQNAAGTILAFRSPAGCSTTCFVPFHWAHTAAVPAIAALADCAPRGTPVSFKHGEYSIQDSLLFAPLDRAAGPDHL